MIRRSTARLALSCAAWLLLLATCPATSWGDTADSCTSAAPDAILQRRLQDAGAAAGALVVVHDGRIDYSDGFGVQTPDGQSVDPVRTVFRAASNGKPMVATAVMQLVAQGRLDLHADIKSYLRLFKVPATYHAPVTLDALLTHSAGFDDHFLGALAAHREDLVPLGPYLARHLPNRVLPPGERIIYSNHAMALAAFGADVDDPGSAHRLRWWETAKVTLVFGVAVVTLLLTRAALGLALGWSAKRAGKPPVRTLAWRVSGWMAITLLAALLLAAGAIVTAGGVITNVPVGVTAALILINLVALSAVVLVPATAYDLIHRRGTVLQRLVLAGAATVALAALPLLFYWNLLGFRS